MTTPTETATEFVRTGFGGLGIDNFGPYIRIITELLEYQIAQERERCAKIVDMRAKVWNDAVKSGAHENCAMSLAEECEDIAAAIRGTFGQSTVGET